MQKPSTLKGFFILTFALSWGLWIPAALTGQASTEYPTILLFLFGGFGPSIVGVWISYRQTGREARRDLWQRLLGFDRISAAWYGLIVLLFPLTFAATYGVNALIGGAPPGLDGLGQIAKQPLSLVSLLLVGIVAGPLSEELGWRGVALDQLQAKWPTWLANLILSVLWWAWHLPLFFIRGTTQNKLGLGTAEFWLFLITIVPLTFLITRVYNANGRSLLSAVLLHFFFNFTLGLVFPMPVSYNVIQVLLTVAAVGILLVVTPASEHSPTRR